MSGNPWDRFFKALFGVKTPVYTPPDYADVDPETYFRCRNYKSAEFEDSYDYAERMADLDAMHRALTKEKLLEYAEKLYRPSFQARVKPWMDACFGAEISADKTERNHRFLEEALELVQANGCTQSEAHQLVDYVYGRPIGELNQEAGGVMVTLAALCLASGLDMHSAGETELQRIWQCVEKIRAKQAAKPRHSPLPE